MTAPDDLFRREALQELSGCRGPGALLRLTPRWVPWLYRTAVVLTLGGLVAGYTIRLDRDVVAAARLDGERGRFVAVVPAADDTRLRRPGTAHLELGGPSGIIRVPVTVRTVRPGTAADVRRSGLASPDGSVQLASGAVSGRAARAAGRATSVRLVIARPPERFLSVLAGGLGGD